VVSPRDDADNGATGWPAHTVHLGRYTRVHANAIAEGLEQAHIGWWYKDPSWLSNVWEFGGVRLFVDAKRLVEAKEIAARVLEADGIPPDAADPGTFF
jgi:hypothetical protein